MNLYRICVLVRYGNNNQQCVCGHFVLKADNIVEALDMAAAECINDYGVFPEDAMVEIVK